MTPSLPDSLFRVIVERSGVPFVIVDETGTVIHAGEGIAAVVGWTQDQVVGHNLGEFLEPEDFELAVAGIAEIADVNNVLASVPIVVPVRHPDGGSRHVEVAALPLPDVGGRHLVALRLRSWEAQRHLSEFVQALRAGTSLEAVLEALMLSLAASMEGVGAAVHHGFDGAEFRGVVGSWPGACALPRHGDPWRKALDATEYLQVDSVDPAARSIGALTAWLVPIRPTAGPQPALLSIWRDRRDPPYIGHRRAFGQAVDYVELALVRSAEHERLLHLAGHDSLTGVGNRATFRDQVATAIASGETNLAVGFCDLDAFKAINDRWGHAVGDELLVQVAARIRSTLRSGDEIARIGGDEFTVLWKQIPDDVAARVVADRVVAAASTPFAVSAGDAHVGISIGYVLARPGATADSLLAAADAALYASKAAGGRRATSADG